MAGGICRKCGEIFTGKNSAAKYREHLLAHINEILYKNLNEEVTDVKALKEIRALVI